MLKVANDEDGIEDVDDDLDIDNVRKEGFQRIYVCLGAIKQGYLARIGHTLA